MRGAWHSARVRILQVAPFVAPLEEREVQLGGAQVVVSELARELARAGHEVTLAAAEGSVVDGVRIAPLHVDPGRLIRADLREREGRRADDHAQRDAFGRVRAWIDAHAGEIDLVHAHAYDAPAFDLLRGAPRPVVHTLHLPPNDREVVRAAASARDAYRVTVSEANARSWRAAGVEIAEVIHNGVDVASIPLGTRRGAHLLYAGRLSPEKGVETALDVAELLGRGIVLVGGAYDERYHASAIAPRVRRAADVGDGPIRDAVYLGARPRRAVYALMARAAVTLLPVRWDEPFGLVAVESLAAGTPVVGYRRGGLAEIVDDEVGALVAPDDVDALARAVARSAGIPPLVCRGRAMAFDVTTMIDRYAALYRRLVART